MFDAQRAQSLAAEISRITDSMTAIAAEQREGILANYDDQLERMNVVLNGVAATQTQLVALIGSLATTLIEYLLDQERQRDLGVTD